MEWLLFVSGVAAVGASVYLGYRERRDFARLQEQAGRTRPGELEEISLVVADLEQELTQTAERITGELEERAATLRRLISEARAAAKEIGAVQVPELEGECDPDRRVETSGGTRFDALAEESDVEAVPEQPAAEERPGPKGWRTVETRVWELSQRGMAVEEIARLLEIGKGEVKLILDLKKAQVR
jgi:hypothetical protein